MEVENHRLVGVPYRPSPNRGGKLVPTHILLHFTAGRSAERSITTLCNPNPPGGPKNRVSAHVVSARDTGLFQLVPFNRIAWHAGKSLWEGRPRVNDFAIGIEMENFGWLRRGADGQWRTWFGQVVPASDVLVATHKHGGRELGWQRFPEKQIAQVYMACEAAIDAYPTIRGVMGHDDVAPGRKKDPGPAWPMDEFRGWLLDRGGP